MRRLILALIFGVLGARAAADLPRHGVIGLQVAPENPNDPAGPANPVSVQRVVPGGAGEAAGFQAGDRIVSVEGQPIERTDQFVRAVSRHLAGEALAVTVQHGGAPEVRTAILKPRPLETASGVEVVYDAVTVRGLRRRIILTRPRREGRMPAVLLVGGLGCYSLDGADRNTGYGRILAAFEAKGFVTLRVEKTGEGDSEGPPCTDLSVTPDVEAEGYLTGLRYLKAREFVDPGRVFIFAHSLGPLIASLIVGEMPLRGFIAVETVGKSWFEYDIERVRVQAALSGQTPEQVDDTVRRYEPCSHRFFVEKEKPEDLLRTPECQDVLSPLSSAPYTYMQAVADISLGKQWKHADLPVLVVYGTASPVTTASQNQYLAELINRMHPHRATYVEVPGMGHDFNRYESQADYHENHGAPDRQFHSGFLDTVMSWLDGVLQDSH